MANFYQVSKEIKGKNYTAQFNGISAALEAIDNSYVDGTSNTSVKKLSEYLFTRVIVDPTNLKIDDFDNIDEFNEVIAFAREVMQGELKPEKTETAKKEK